MKEYTVIYEQGKEGEENWGAYVPDLPGCTTTGDTFEAVQQHIQEAIDLYREVLMEEGKPMPEPTTRAGIIPVAA